MRGSWLILVLILLLLSADVTESKKKKKKKKVNPARRLYADDFTKITNTMLITVNDVEDRVRTGPDQEGRFAPQSDKSSCSTSSGAADARPKYDELKEGEYGCTLRGAMEMAAGIGGDTNRMRIVVRPGRFRLRGPLPEVSGVVDIVGSGGRRKPRRALPNPVGKMSAPKPGKETQGLVDEKERKRLQQKREDESDDADIYYNPDAGTGQTSPIGTVIDGDGKFQILRTASGSVLKLEDLRFEDGRAVEKSADVRDGLGGAINAFGKLIMSNVVMRKNRAINGGAIYTEAPIDAKDSLFEYNFAEECGGMMYAGAFGGDRKISSCKIDVNQESNCKERPPEPKEEDAWIVKNEKSKGAASSKGGVFEFDDEDDEDDPPPPATTGTARKLGEPDPQGAIFEGPRLTGWSGDPKDKPLKPKNASKEVPDGEPTEEELSDYDRLTKEVPTGGKEAAGDKEGAPPSKRPKRKGGGEKYDPRADSAPPPGAPPSKKKKKKLSSIKAVFDELERLSQLDDDDDEFDDEEDDDEFDDADDFDDEDLERQRRRRRGKFGQKEDKKNEPPSPPKECHPEKHGGETGGVHELSCQPGLWRTGRKQPTECLIWRSTFNCSGIDGDRNPDKDKDCYQFVPDGESGYCECAGGREAGHSDCQHEPFTCQQACRQMRESRRRRRNVERRQNGEPVPPPPPPQPKLYAIGAFGKAGNGHGGLLDSVGLYCSDGSWTSTAGSPPTAKQGYEFLCPGWEVCKDDNETCVDWAKRGECAKNPDYMKLFCKQSCNNCPELQVPEVASGLVGVDVRAGKLVDSIRFHCAPPGYERPHEEEVAATKAARKAAAGGAAGEDDDDDDGGVFVVTADGATNVEDAAFDTPEDTQGSGGGSDDKTKERRPPVKRDNVTTSAWFGGDGGHECALGCLSENHTEGWRIGGFISSLSIAAGMRVDRVELTKCSRDVDI